MSETIDTNVTVTERAAKHIAELLGGETAAQALRVAVESGGCSGLQYKFDLVPAAEPEDIVLERAGAKVVIDKVSLGFLAGLADRLRQRPDGRRLPHHQSQGDRLVRMRHELHGLSRTLCRIGYLSSTGPIVTTAWVSGWQASSYRSYAAPRGRRVDRRQGRRPADARPHVQGIPAGHGAAAMEALAGKIKAADAFVFVTGEYNWGMQPGLKNLTDHFLEEWFWRPAAIASYSAGRLSGVRSSIDVARDLVRDGHGRHLQHARRGADRGYPRCQRRADRPSRRGASCRLSPLRR